MKACLDCKAEKPLDLFPKEVRNSDGRGSYCKECKKVRTYGWRERNADRLREYQRTRYATVEGDRRRAGAVRYRADHVIENRLYANQRRKRLASNGVFRVAQRDVRRLRESGCAVCGSRESIELDHIVPVSRGGRHSIGNLQVLCQSHNRAKRDRLFADFRYRVLTGKAT